MLLPGAHCLQSAGNFNTVSADRKSHWHHCYSLQTMRKIRSFSRMVTQPVMMRTVMSCTIVTVGRLSRQSDRHQGTAIIFKTAKLQSCLLFVTSTKIVMMLMMVLWATIRTRTCELLCCVYICCFLALLYVAFWHFIDISCCVSIATSGWLQELLVTVFLRDLFPSPAFSFG